MDQRTNLSNVNIVPCCSRCGRPSSELVFDDLSSREFCPACRLEVERRRMVLGRPGE